ncbi:MAG: phosphotransferase [Candidatus Portnoybacteria bacterium]|nr:phosphotransferase [Candidatus Portnoybacteria bacterium]
MKANIFVILDVNYIKKLFNKKKLLYFPERREVAITKIEIKKNSPVWAKETCLAEYKIFFDDGSVKMVRGTASGKDSKRSVWLIMKYLKRHGLCVARPLDFISQLNFFLYEEVMGVSLFEIFQAGESKKIEKVLKGAGNWLAKLHGFVPEKVFQPVLFLGAKDYGSAFKKIAKLAPRLKKYFLSFEELVRLDKISRERTVLIHNDFYPGNIILASGDIYAIDFDKSGLGPPLMDVTLLFGWLDVARSVWKLGFRRNDIQRFQKIFLASYCKEAGLDYFEVRRSMNRFLVKVYLDQAYNYIDMCVRSRKSLNSLDKKDFKKKIGIFLKRAGYYLRQENFS